MFSTKDQNVAHTVNQFIEPGRVLAHVYSAELKTSKTGKKMLNVVLETTEKDGFEGYPVDKNDKNGTKHTGAIGIVAATIYIDEVAFNSNSPKTNGILNTFMYIADSLGVRPALDAIDGVASINEWVEKAVEVVKGQDIWWFLKAKQEAGTNGKVYTKLSFPRDKYISKDENNLEVYDKTNIYHFQPLVGATEVASFQAPEAAKSVFDI